MPKRRFISEAKADDDGYADAECPECGAIVNAHFPRGRNWRRLECPVCRTDVTLTLDKPDANLIQLRGINAE